MPARQRGLITLILMLLATTVAAAPETHVFDLEHRRASSVLPQLRGLYGDDATFSPDGQKLMVRAEAEQLAEIDQLLRTLDEPPRQVRLEVRHRDRVSDSRGVDSERVYSTRRDSVRSITIKDGQMASISSGTVTRVPVAARGGEHPAAVLEEVDLSSGFLVRPSVISDDQVELQITALRNEPIENVTDYHTAGVVTVRRARPGEWVRLGGERSAHQSREGSRVYASSGKKDRIWEVRTQILKSR